MALLAYALLPFDSKCCGALAACGSWLMMLISGFDSDCRSSMCTVCARLWSCCLDVARMFVDLAPGQKITSKPAPAGMMKVEV